MLFEDLLKNTGEVGYVSQVSQSVVQIDGLPGAILGEELVFASGQTGQVVSLGKDYLESLSLSVKPVTVGTQVARTGHRLAVAVSEQLLGKTVNSLGKTIGAMEKDKDGAEMREVDIHAPGIASRAKVSKLLETGMTLVDLMVPVGRGQRELVMGDRKTGKSHLLLKSAVAQGKSGGVCIYAAIGKRKQEIRQVEEYLQSVGAMATTVIVSSSSHESPGEIYLNPFTAMTIAEYFRDHGRDVLLILDDLTTHAKFYREVSLLGRRFPGRDSYPGDVFYTHSRLLERAGNFLIAGQELSITCLPVVETNQGDFTGYIQTNLMSMTDGHIFFDADLYFAGRRPAVNIFVSVTRVGHQTQSQLRREIHRTTLDLMANYARVQDFVRFGADLGDNSRQVLALGDRLLTFFDQPNDILVPLNVQTVLWALLWNGTWLGKNTTGLVKQYQNDAHFRTWVNNLVANSDSVTTLLANVGNNSELLLTMLK